jgi:hypothetical protein
VVFDENLKYQVIDQQTLKKVYFNRLDDFANKFYFTKYTGIKNIVCELNKPMIYDNKFNVCPAIKATYSPYESFDEEIKKKVNLFLGYIKEVLSSNNEASYDYILNWIANMLQGNKNDACIYLKGGQGIGKSTISDFLKENVIGTDLFLETGSDPIRNRFNSILQGKLLVQFSELENFSTKEWISISSVLKRNITSTTYTIEAKNENSRQIKNINNYILDSNNDSIKDDEGRRYYIADVSTKRQDDRVYFGRIRRECFHDEVGNAFYSLMRERDVSGFIPQNYPETKSKMDSMVKRLDSTYLFLKNEFVLQNLCIKHKPNDLFNDYENYCVINNITRVHKKLDFIAKLRDIGIEYKKTGGTHWFKVSVEELKNIADKGKWIHELDKNDDDHDDDDDDEKTIDDKTETVSNEDYVQSLLNKIAELEKKLKEKETETEEEECILTGKCYINLDALKCDNVEEDDDDDGVDILGKYFD